MVPRHVFIACTFLEPLRGLALVAPIERREHAVEVRERGSGVHAAVAEHFVEQVVVEQWDWGVAYGFC